MKRFITLLLTLIAAGTFTLSFAACGDDDDDNGSSDGDTDNDGDGSDSNTSGSGADDPFEGLDCTTTDTATCDYSACVNKAALDTINETCAQYTGNTEWETYCDDVIACYATFVTCFTDACPAGGTYADANADTLTACTNDWTTCTTSITQPTAK